MIPTPQKKLDQTPLYEAMLQEVSAARAELGGLGALPCEKNCVLKGPFLKQNGCFLGPSSTSVLDDFKKGKC